MKPTFVITLASLLLAALAGAQTPVPETPTPAAYTPTFIVGAGVTYGNPGFAAGSDIDIHASGNLYAHIAIDSIKLKNGSVMAFIRPGAEYHFWRSQSSNVEFIADGDGGGSLGSPITLSAFTSGGYVSIDVCNAVRGLNHLGHCYLGLGARVMVGSVVSSTASTPVQLIPTLQFRFGSK